MMLRFFLQPSPSSSSKFLPTSSSSRVSSRPKISHTSYAHKYSRIVCCVSLPDNNNKQHQTTTTTTTTHGSKVSTSSTDKSIVISELYAIAEVVVDRAEMHANIGEQRNNWNNLLLNSINSITLTASLMAGLASISASTASILGLKLSSTLLYAAATVMLLVVNKIQPSQLAEEQRNASRLFRQLHEKIKTTIATHTSPTLMDVKNTMERVLAIDKAYPLPLLGGVMLNKFPKNIEPAVWWPKETEHHQQQQSQHGSDEKSEINGWSGELEQEMRGIAGVLKRKDTSEYVRLGKRVLNLNRVLSILGPLFTGLGALGSTMMGSPNMYGSWALVFAVLGGAMASVVNTLEHGGQVGMVFEMYRNCSGFYRFVEDSIESSLEEMELGNRENGELFEIKVALELGRSLSELRDLASKASISSLNGQANGDDDDTSQFAGKLF